MNDQAYLFNLTEVFFYTLVNQVTSAGALFAHQERYQSFIKHVRCANKKDGKSIIFVWKYEFFSHLLIIPANLENKNR